MFDRKEKRTWTERNLSAAVPGVRGLRQEEVGVVFQPIVEVATGALFATRRSSAARDPSTPLRRSCSSTPSGRTPAAASGGSSAT